MDTVGDTQYRPKVRLSFPELLPLQGWAVSQLMEAQQLTCSFWLMLQHFEEQAVHISLAPISVFLCHYLRYKLSVYFTELNSILFSDCARCLPHPLFFPLESKRGVEEQFAKGPWGVTQPIISPFPSSTQRWVEENRKGGDWFFPG